ncbi:MAG: SpoIIE family protein phosphatase [Chloroflexaceae bacterium]|nr:SpoIIE family protein phosphatase [Chloroflexaceae bacterium]
MEETVAQIQCLNLNCQTVNSPEQQYCYRCNTPLLKRYLLAMGESLQACPLGTLIGDRYLLKQPRVVLDTKPGLPPQVTQTIPDALLPYFQLFPQRLHVPQVYGFTTLNHQLIWLLEYGTVPLDSDGTPLAAQLLPQLVSVWGGATALRQLNWLWQMVQLWQPLRRLRVVSSLLDASVLRVNGPLIQLLELRRDGDRSPTLQQLGQFWSEWIASCSPSIGRILTQICLSLEQGQIGHPEQLLAVLDRAMLQIGKSWQRTSAVYTATDTGPTREQNEDACYPASGSSFQVTEDLKTLVLVCDGLGGQEGGEVASHLAIESLSHEVTQIAWEERGWNAGANLLKLERAICNANDLISQRNDREQRYERQRMGTTLVMAIAHNHELYFAHVGDSRLYWITATGCYQVTVDDDLASREVQLGYAFYREATRYSSAGALVQALGMDASALLRPNVQRLILDEDGVFLLCSDGLSDFDRVEQYWKREILPVLRGERDLAEAGKRLMETANETNGHDNVTIALLYYRVQQKTEEIHEAEITLTEIQSMLPSVEDFEYIASDTKPNVIAPQSSLSNVRERPAILWAILLVSLLGLGGIIYIVFSNQVNHQIEQIEAAPK